MNTLRAYAKRIALSAILPLMLASTSIVALAAPAHTMKHAAKAAPLICPVTGNKIASAKDAYNHETYKGKTYYFCCPMCKPKFDKDPAGTIANAAKGKYQKM